MIKNTLFLFVALFLFSFKANEATIWNLDNSHARVGFSITHMSISDVDGYFKRVSARVSSKNQDFSDAVAEMTAEVSSINTDNEKRDEHLTSADFFDAGKYPLITFKSTSFKKGTGNTYNVKGNLTMHGVTKPVSLLAVAKKGLNPMSKKEVAGFKLTGKINRKDFGLGTTTPSSILSDKVDVIVNAEFIKE